jgi:hypothetical protein
MAQPQLPHAPVVVLIDDDEHVVAPVMNDAESQQPSTPTHQVIPTPKSPPNVNIEHAKAKARGYHTA